ncbi:hypothetical protein C8Q75DRAFT_785863 [Abortiporus biennis]|nr:hypothetical protein C8Q75DRAFT_785863 [Abortiporus biennis]
MHSLLRILSPHHTKHSRPPSNHDVHHQIETLPQEICNVIIDQLRDNRSTLTACALVSHAWLEHTRHHLFHTTTVNGFFFKFERFLSATPSVCGHIYQLKLSHGVDLDNSDEESPSHAYSDDDHFTSSEEPVKETQFSATERESSLLNASLLISILGHLPNLQKLELSYSFWNGGIFFDPLLHVHVHPKSEVPTAHVPTPISLKELRLFGLVFPSCSDTQVNSFLTLSKAFLHLLSLFAQVDYLSIDYLFPEHENTFRAASYSDLLRSLHLLQEHDIPPALQVRSLRLDDAILGYVTLELIRRTHVTESLRNLDFVCGDWDMMQAGDALIRDTGPNLESLRIDMCEFVAQETKAHTDLSRNKVLSLSTCDNLQSFSVILWLSDDEIPRSIWHFNTLLEILSSLPTPSTLHTFTLILGKSRYHHGDILDGLECLNWFGLDKLLSGFNNLQRVNLGMRVSLGGRKYNEIDPLEILEYESIVFETKLPGALSRGILDFRDESELLEEV